MIYESFSIEDTKLIARNIGQKANAGDIYCLNGDLGSGKTLFCKGFAEGLVIKDNITSPTFNIMNIYEGRIKLYHFDVYRIKNIDEMYDTGYEEFFFGDGVCLVEWSNLISELIPKGSTQINIFKDLKKGENYRVIEVNYDSISN